MKPEKKDRLIVLDNWLKSYTDKEVGKLKRIERKTEIQAELLKIFTLILEFQALETEFLTDLAKDIDNSETWKEYYKQRAKALAHLCAIHGIDTSAISYNKDTDY